MSNILVRDLDDKIIGRLKAIAKNHGRSLQGEVKAILTDAISFLSMKEAASVVAGWRKKLKGRQFSDSTDLIREDRDR